MGHGAPGVSELHASRRVLTGLWRLGGLRRWIAYRRRHRFGWFGSRIRNDVRLARRVGRRWRFDRLGAVRMQGRRGRGGVVWHVGFLVFLWSVFKGSKGCAGWVLVAPGFFACSAVVVLVVVLLAFP